MAPKTISRDNTQSKPVVPVQVAFPLSATPDAVVHLHITNHAHALMLVLSTTSPLAKASGPPNLSSFVFALPNQIDQTAQPLSTPLYSHTGSVDFMTRLAKILAKKLNKPAYVGGDVKFWSHEDEVEATKSVVETVMKSIG